MTMEIVCVPKGGTKDQFKSLEKNQQQIAQTIGEIYKYLINEVQEQTNVIRQNKRSKISN